MQLSVLSFSETSAVKQKIKISVFNVYPQGGGIAKNN